MKGRAGGPSGPGRFFRWACICAGLLLSLILHTGLAQPAAPPAAPPAVERYGSRGVRVHDPSTIVRCGEEYWLFYTGRGIPSYRSKDLVKWERGPAVFSAAPPWVAATVPGMRFPTYFWAPDVIRVRDRYFLYYSASTFGKNTSAIGLAIGETLDPADPRYGWVDQGIVVQSSAADNFNAIDPALTIDADGKLWMSFGSFWSGIKMIELDPKTGKRVAPNSPIFPLARTDAIEAPFIHRRDGHYYLFVNWDICCRGEQSTYNIRVGRSEKITGPYLDKEGKSLLEGGGSLVLRSDGAFIGPGHAGIVVHEGREFLSCHFYDATRGGASTLSIQPLGWSSDGWPVVQRAGEDGKAERVEGAGGS